MDYPRLANLKFGLLGLSLHAYTGVAQNISSGISRISSHVVTFTVTGRPMALSINLGVVNALDEEETEFNEEGSDTVVASFGLPAAVLSTTHTVTTSTSIATAAVSSVKCHFSTTVTIFMRNVDTTCHHIMHL